MNGIYAEEKYKSERYNSISSSAHMVIGLKLSRPVHTDKDYELRLIQMIENRFPDYSSPTFTRSILD
ncbi:MAG: hypothetical protein IJ679_10065 [Lachnospiraceae bacterium]|nr:hypothetical protein [Lachnospiraceae bacterium]